MTFLAVYITHENEEEARKVISHLLDKRLIACSNVFPIKSMFEWKGEMKDENEVVSIVKTSPKNWEKLCEEAKKVHPYETPAIIKFEVEANKDFEDWVKENTE